MSEPTHAEFILKMHCPDRPGILAMVTAAIAQLGGDVRDAQSFGDNATGEFFVRMHLKLPGADDERRFRTAMEQVSQQLGVSWSLESCAAKPRILVLVSRFDHCLVDLLHRIRVGSLVAQVPLVISNHADTGALVHWHDIPFLHLPVNNKTRPEQEAQILENVKDHDIDLVVLARYMQILSPGLCKALSGRCINIHHSFLPSFKGANPYRQAHDHGVKIIGATAHYVTEDLDEGPIIEQDVRRVSHATSVEEMTAIGRETESSVLARAVRWHVEHRVLMNGTKTVVFA